MIVPPRIAALVGFGAGLVFFGADFSWFGESAGALLGPFGFILDIGPAAIEAVAFSLAAALSALAAARLRDPWVALVAAAGFTLAEMLRAAGLLAVPLYQIGAAFVDTPLKALAAAGGVYSVTFAVALVSALAARALLAAATEGGKPRRARIGELLGAGGAVALATALAWLSWPARSVPPGAMRVAAVQGNITQTVKWDAASLPLAVERYTALTRSIENAEPAFVLWPETVITTELQLDSAAAASPAYAESQAAAPALRAQFTALAKRLDTILAVGSNEATAVGAYNDLFFFTERGLETTYRKRRLVPFAEYLPGPPWLRGLPFATLVSNFALGAPDQPLGPLGAAPLICWEAGFGELAQRDAARGAAFIAIATDDAWFGTSDGPYAQAQLAQLRAIETGRWVLRAAATGISGIVGPDGVWRTRSTLGTQTVVLGTIGKPQPTAYSSFGPWPVGGALAAITAAGLLAGRKRRR